MQASILRISDSVLYCFLLTTKNVLTKAVAFFIRQIKV